MQGYLLINPRSGSGRPGVDELIAAARKRGVDAHVLRQGDDAAELARAAGAALLGVAGGDGSLAPVAQVALDTEAAFIAVPCGTRNHFARDARYDRHDPIRALDAFACGVERRVDVGRVGRRIFMNNVSLGEYAWLVYQRERHRRRREALARARALLAVARHPDHLHAVVDGHELDARVLLVGNNRYDLSLFTLGEREHLDEGVLDLRTAADVLPTTWKQHVARQFRIELPKPRVEVAIDGEPVVLDTPLELESLPQALRILVPDA